MQITYLIIPLVTSVSIKYGICGEYTSVSRSRECKENELLVGLCRGETCPWDYKCCELEADNGSTPTKIILNGYEVTGNVFNSAGNASHNLYCQPANSVAHRACISTENNCHQNGTTAIRCTAYQDITINYNACEASWVNDLPQGLSCGADKFAVQFCRAPGTTTSNCGIIYTGSMQASAVTSLDDSLFQHVTSAYQGSILCCSMTYSGTFNFDIATTAQSTTDNLQNIGSGAELTTTIAATMAMITTVEETTVAETSVQAIITSTALNASPPSTTVTELSTAISKSRNLLI